ncbi:MAG: hypothetical protein IT378_27510 [Sandaracinaceae bacterium]|nr:hypothetical protein [Sandaracinaceae bacterium]
MLCFAVAWLAFPRPAPATIAEQRARLPPAAECGGEIVAGVWRSHKYDPRYSDWTVFTLNIRRVPGAPAQLTGTIVNHSWDGGPELQEPPPCAQSIGTEWIVSMDARGSVTNETSIQFGGIGRWRIDEVRCRRGPWGYNLDNFTGVIDPAILEFQSVNNDGGRSVNDPMVFRRIRCPPEEHAQAPSVNPRPPAFYPELGRGGCSAF